jgi:pyruvate formate lyase activating enzyme
MTLNQDYSPRRSEPPAGQGEPQGLIFNLMRYAVKDGPGLRTTVFLKGCPLTCAWCHNPESQEAAKELIFRSERCLGCGDCIQACTQGALREQNGSLVRDEAKCLHCGACTQVCPSQAREMMGREYSVSQVMEEILKDRAFYEESGGGVTFSGGEPLMQLDFLEALLRCCRNENLHTVVDTSGAVPYNNIDRIRSYVDLFLYDLKCLDEQVHERLTGASNRRILGNLQKLAEAGQQMIIRLPLIPGVNDDDKSVRDLGAFVSSLPGRQELEILPYHDTAQEKYRLLGRRPMPLTGAPLTQERIEAIAARLQDMGIRLLREL